MKIFQDKLSINFVDENNLVLGVRFHDEYSKKFFSFWLTKNDERLEDGFDVESYQFEKSSLSTGEVISVKLRNNLSEEIELLFFNDCDYYSIGFVDLFGKEVAF